MTLSYFLPTPQATHDLAQRLARKLSPGQTVLLFGDLGAGKTQFVKGLAYGLGITQPVQSPTYAYVNRYRLSEGDFFYHYDLYRLEPGEETASIGLEDSLSESGSLHAIEWADRLTSLPPNAIHVRLSSQLQGHRATIRFEDSQIPSAAQIDEFYLHWATPLHVRRHMAQVAKVSLTLAQAYAETGHIVNAELLYAAAMLHDVARVCDFRTLNRADFSEEITGEKWNRWMALRERFKGQSHPVIGQNFLAEKGFTKTADLVYAHGSRTLVQEPHCLESLEAKILYYADKRVKHDQIVSLTERFHDGRERYGDADESNRLFFAEVEEKAFILEKELFEPLGIKPENLH